MRNLHKRSAAAALMFLLAFVVGYLILDAGPSDPETPPAEPAAETQISDSSGSTYTQSPATESPAAGEPAPSPQARTEQKSAGAQTSVSELARVASDNGVDAAIGFARTMGMTVDAGRVTLVIESADAAEAQRASEAARSYGAVLQAANGNLAQVSVPVESVGQLLADPGVAYLREPFRATAATVSEGVLDSGASIWQGEGFDGNGVKLAILDVGFSGYQQRITEGDLPADVTVMSFRADGDITAAGEVHGTACAEIAHDMAPGAQLYLVNFSTDVELANAVDYLKSEGVGVISASWSFFSRFRGDGQGPIDDIVQGAVDSGIFWANASGNSARSHWSGSFSDADADSWTEFTPGDETNDLSAASGSRIDVYLTWDRWPATDQDYDLYLFWSGNPNQPVAASEGWQGGTQPPAEELHYIVPPGHGGTYYIEIYSYSTVEDAVFQLYATPYDLQYQVPEGSLGGQPTDSAKVMTVGAVPVGTTVLESFSSRGPTIDGRTKPDIVAPDRVSTASYGAAGFWGTSAATPHVAGAAALVLQTWPVSSPAQVQAELESRATDLGDLGKDNLFGAGKLDLFLPPDLVPPDIISVEPAGSIYTTDAVVSVYYDDTGSGIDTSSVALSLDGAPMPDCSVSQQSASCAVHGLALGQHVISGSVADNAGNTTPVDGSFEVICEQPNLVLGAPQPFWGSYADYEAGLLSVTFSFCNTGGGDANGMQLVGSANSSGVILFTSVPFQIGDIAGGSCTDATFKYLVPPGVTAFKSTIYVTAADACGFTYAYPGPLY